MGDYTSRVLNPLTRRGAALLDDMINHQARIIAYNNDFRLMILTIVPPMLLLLFMRRHVRQEAAVGDD
jgi:MFS transporter, DHA2 family, multidrug resistance protein